MQISVFVGVHKKYIDFKVDSTSRNELLYVDMKENCELKWVFIGFG